MTQRLTPLAFPIKTVHIATNIPITLRPILPADLWPLHTSCYADQPPLKFETHFQQMWRWQENGRCCWLVAKQKEQLLGSGQLIVYAHIAEITNLFVVSTHRQQGIGTALVQTLTAVATKHQLPQLDISIQANNHRAQRLYHKLGFTYKRTTQLSHNETIITLTKQL